MAALAENLINLAASVVSLEDDTMPLRLRGKSITYRTLPPRMKLVQPEPAEEAQLPPVQRYLKRLDRELDQCSRLGLVADSSSARSEPYDLVAHVFANQLTEQSQQAYHLADQIIRRQELAQKHLRDIQWRLDTLKQRRPLPLRGPHTGADDGAISEADKQILDLERQQRIIQLDLWRDLIDMRKDLADARRSYRSTRWRLEYLTGGDDGGR